MQDVTYHKVPNFDETCVRDPEKIGKDLSFQNQIACGCIQTKYRIH